MWIPLRDSAYKALQRITEKTVLSISSESQCKDWEDEITREEASAASAKIKTSEVFFTETRKWNRLYSMIY